MQSKRTHRTWVSKWLVLPALVLTLMLALSYSHAPTVSAANGDNLRTFIMDRTGTDCASYDAAGNHPSVGVGLAFDGANLLASCYSDNTVTAVSPANGSQVAVHTINGASSLGALAWDNGRAILWACSGFDDVGLIDLTTNVFTFVFTTSNGCFDGLAYDASDDTIWASGDAVGSIQHYMSSGASLSSHPITLGGCGNSGIAVGGALLYLANNGCSQIYTNPKDFLSPPTLFADFPARIEDLECDNVTFAGKGAIWSVDAYDNTLNAWEIPDGSCDFGGGSGGPTQHPGTVPALFACGTYVRGGENSGIMLNPGNYSYVIPSPLGISGAGTSPDRHWVHSTGTNFVVYDMGAPVPAAFYIPSIDHLDDNGTAKGEAIEATLYGTNNLSALEGTWEAGTISDIYVQGYDALWIADDYSTRWTFSQSYRYIGIIHGGPGALVNDGDAEIDAVCAEGTGVTATKFYDANANGIQDGTETGIAGWSISADATNTSLTSASGQAAFVLQAGAHTIAEGTPVQTNWFHTTAASVNITVPTTTAVSFGNVCVGAGGGLTLGYWSNKNGQATMNDGGSVDPELALLTGRNLRNANGSPFDPSSYGAFRTWILNANATNMAYMLSAQLAAMELNVESGLVSGSALIYAPGTTSANALGFATVNAIMAEANAELGLHGTALSGATWRAYEQALKNALDNANNNKTFVQATACAFTFGG